MNRPINLALSEVEAQRLIGALSDRRDTFNRHGGVYVADSYQRLIDRILESYNTAFPEIRV